MSNNNRTYDDTFPIVWFNKDDKDMYRQFTAAILAAFDEWDDAEGRTGEYFSPNNGAGIMVNDLIHITGCKFWFPKSKESKILAFAAIEIQKSLWIGSVRLVERSDGDAVYLPRQEQSNGGK